MQASACQQGPDEFLPASQSPFNTTTQPTICVICPIWCICVSGRSPSPPASAALY